MAERAESDHLNHAAFLLCYGAFKATSQVVRSFHSLQPVGRIGQPEEIAAAVLYLCSPSARFTTGTTLSVDGGITV